MTRPALGEFYAAIDATWPARRVIDLPGWQLREGGGGGSRVSAATATSVAPDIHVMEAAQANLGQDPLVMIRDGDATLDNRLAAAGYHVFAPVTLYAGPVDALTEPPPPVTVFCTDWPPAGIQVEIWAAGGIGPARLAVMDRVAGAKCAILGRASDQPAGVAFVACHGPIAMLHALEVTPSLRRQNLGRHMMHGAAIWSAEQGAQWLAVLVTDENEAANALYASLGMEPVGSYHYRLKRPKIAKDATDG